MSTSITCENFVLIYKFFAKILPYEIKLNFFQFHMGLKDMCPLKVCNDNANKNILKHLLNNSEYQGYTKTFIK